MELSPHSLTPKNYTAVFGVWLGTVGLLHPLPFSALPLRLLFEASSKAVSRRTSYYQVRLAFHHYPQLIPAFCTARGFGPSQPVTVGSTWPWIDHLVSGLVCTTKSGVNPCFHYAFALLRLRQAVHTNSLAHSSIGTPSLR